VEEEGPIDDKLIANGIALTLVPIDDHLAIRRHRGDTRIVADRSPRHLERAGRGGVGSKQQRERGRTSSS